MSRAHGKPLSAVEGFLLQRVEYRDADLIVTVFTLEHGRLSALARGARNSRQRFGGRLEPFHTLALSVDLNTRGELGSLRDAQLRVTRSALCARLECMEAAGKALNWVRQAARDHAPEPALYQAITNLLDRLNAPERPTAPQLLVSEFGLRLLGASGWGMDFERCVRCGKPCAAARAALIDPARGGLVCRACGGARLRLDANQRIRFAAAARGEQGQLEASDEGLAAQLIERALDAHAGLAP